MSNLKQYYLKNFVVINKLTGVTNQFNDAKELAEHFYFGKNGGFMSCLVVVNEKVVLDSQNLVHLIWPEIITILEKTLTESVIAEEFGKPEPLKLKCGDRIELKNGDVRIIIEDFNDQSEQMFSAIDPGGLVRVGWYTREGLNALYKDTFSKFIR